jgi:hypothetical protein
MSKIEMPLDEEEDFEPFKVFVESRIDRGVDGSYKVPSSVIRLTVREK